MEDKLMMNIIHENYLKTRKINKEKEVLNIKNKKKNKRELIINNIIICASGLLFFTGLILLISVINNLSF